MQNIYFQLSRPFKDANRALHKVQALSSMGAVLVPEGDHILLCVPASDLSVTQFPTRNGAN